MGISADDKVFEIKIYLAFLLTIFRFQAVKDYRRMKLQTEKKEDYCPRAEIAAYVDGELSPREELELECHFAVCQSCKAELNQQKNLLCALDFAFVGEKEIELPENFTKTVVINAESKVQGLRCPKERSRALLLCAGLFLLILIGLGSEIEAFFSTFAVFFEQVWTIASFVGHLIYDAAIAFTTILRLFGGQFLYSSNLAIVAWGAVLILVLYVVSRLMLRVSR